ncbi:kelch repeat and BTB domain-containing protein 2-like [Amphiura filiformis]|uniref:kelch repeat and BTB domain-containing protein 2-like n=1 Tax=Amphiura filiformis TaxID=82378 RepID=UPI003B21F573
MFSSGFQESRAKEVELRDMDGAIFELIFNFMYSGKMVLSADTAIPAFHAVVYLELHNAERPFLDYFTGALQENNLTPGEVLSIWDAAKEHDMDELASKFYDQMLNKFQKVVKSDLFVEKASIDLIYDYLKRDTIHFGPDCSEEQLLRHVIQWLKHDWENRKIDAFDLLQKFRLGLLPKDKVQELLDDQILEIPECKEMMDDLVKNWTELEGVKDPLKLPESFLPRGMRRTLIGFGGKREIQCEVHESESEKMELFGHYFDKENEEWNVLSYPKLPGDDNMLAYSSVVVVNRDIYLAGGLHNNEDESDNVYESQRCFKLNGKNYKWTELPPMKFGRIHFALVHHDGFLYAIGGKGDHRQFSEAERELDGIVYLDCAERFNISKNKWDRIYPLPDDMMYTSAVVVDDKILVYGMTDFLQEEGRNEFKLVGFDPRNQRWTELARETFPSVDVDIPYILVVHDGVCYRVRYKATSAGATWTLAGETFTPQVNRVEIKTRRTRRAGLMACIGRKIGGQDALAYNKAGAFHIDGHIYINVCGYAHKTGAVFGDSTEWDLNGWSQCQSMNLKCVVEYAFDTKKMW